MQNRIRIKSANRCPKNQPPVLVQGGHLRVLFHFRAMSAILPPYAGQAWRDAQRTGEDFGGMHNSNIQDLYSTGRMHFPSLARNWSASGPGADRYAHSASPGSAASDSWAALAD